MGEMTKRRAHIFLAVAAALAAVALVTPLAAARDADVGGTVALEQRGVDLGISGGGQVDEGVVGLDGRMRVYFSAASEDAFAVAVAGASTPLAFQGGRSLWTPLVTVNPIEGLFFGVGAFRADAIVGAPNLAFNQHGLGLGGAYQDDGLSLYLIGLNNSNRLGSTTRSSGDFTTYQVSAGGTMTRSPVGMGVDLFYFDRAERERAGEAGLAATSGLVSGRTPFAEEVLFSGFFDSDSALYRRITGGGKAGATAVGSTGQTKTPANVRAIGGHLDFRPMTETVFQLGGAYLQFVEEVTSFRGGNRDESLGTSMYFRLTHGINNGLQLKAAFDYLFPADGNRDTKGDEEAYKVAAGLFWSW
jgi:hypothetical protein